MKNVILITLFLSIVPLQMSIASPFAKEGPKPSEEVFKTEVEKGDENLRVIFNVEQGYYVYKDRIEVIVDGEEVDAQFPSGFIKEDPVFEEKMEVYPFDFSIKFNNKGQDEIKIKHQGCAPEKSFCYPPRVDVFNI